MIQRANNELYSTQNYSELFFTIRNWSDIRATSWLAQLPNSGPLTAALFLPPKIVSLRQHFRFFTAGLEVEGNQNKDGAIPTVTTEEYRCASPTQFRDRWGENKPFPFYTPNYLSYHKMAWEERSVQLSTGQFHNDHFCWQHTLAKKYVKNFCIYSAFIWSIKLFH